MPMPASSHTIEPGISRQLVEMSLFTIAFKRLKAHLRLPCKMGILSRGLHFTKQTFSIYRYARRLKIMSKLYSHIIFGL